MSVIHSRLIQLLTKIWAKNVPNDVFQDHLPRYIHKNYASKIVFQRKNIGMHQIAQFLTPKWKSSLPWEGGHPLAHPPPLGRFAPSGSVAPLPCRVSLPASFETWHLCNIHIMFSWEIRALARFLELGDQKIVKYTFEVNWVSNSFSSHYIIHKKYGYLGVQNQQ